MKQTKICDISMIANNLYYNSIQFKSFIDTQKKPLQTYES